MKRCVEWTSLRLRYQEVLCKSLGLDKDLVGAKNKAREVKRDFRREDPTISFPDLIKEQQALLRH